MNWPILAAGIIAWAGVAWLIAAIAYDRATFIPQIRFVPPRRPSQRNVSNGGSAVAGEGVGKLHEDATSAREAHDNG